MATIAYKPENWQAEIRDLETTPHFFDALRRAESAIAQAKLTLRQLSLHTESSRKQIAIEVLIDGQNVCLESLARLKGGKAPTVGVQ